MRINIDIDDRLMRQALHASRRPTKRGVVEEALRLLVQTRSQIEIRKLRGRIRWTDDLETGRASRSVERD
jgi:Arc/MetJ family transcription regulator